MRKSAQVALWAVYQVTIQGKPGPNVVCLQHEWDAIEKDAPGLHRLIRGGIANESEAERLARGTSGDDPVRQKKLLTAKLAEPEPYLVVDSEAETGIAEGQDHAGPLLLPFPTGPGPADEPPGQVEPDGEVA